MPLLLFTWTMKTDDSEPMAGKKNSAINYLPLKFDGSQLSVLKPHDTKKLHNDFLSAMSHEKQAKLLAIV